MHVAILQENLVNAMLQEEIELFFSFVLELVVPLKATLEACKVETSREKHKKKKAKK